MPVVAAEEPKPGLEKPSLLTETPKPEVKVEAKPGEANPAAEAKPGEEKPAEGAVPEVVAEPPKPVYEAFKLPEGMKADDTLMAEFTDLLGTHKLTQDQGQALIDLNSKAMTAYATQFEKHYREEQWKQFNDLNAKWVSEIKADKEYGGSRFETSSVAAARVLDTLLTKKERAEFNQFLDTTGAGNNPWMFRILNRFSDWVNESSAPKAASKPAPTNGQEPGQSRSLRKGLYKQNGAAP